MDRKIGDTIYFTEKDETSKGEIIAIDNRGRYIVTFDRCDDEVFAVNDMNDGFYSKLAPPTKQEKEAIILLKGLGYTVLLPTTTEGA